MRLLLTLLLIAFATLAPKNLAAQYGGGTTYYTVKFPDDVKIRGCRLSPPPAEWPDIERVSTCNFNVGVSIRDQIYYTGTSRSCYKIVRRYRLVDWCVSNRGSTPFYVFNPPGTDVGAKATGNAFNRGFLEYEQIITVIDDSAPRFIDCPAKPVIFCDVSGNDPRFYNDGHKDRCEGKADLRIAVTDICSGSAVNLRYILRLDMDGDGFLDRTINSMTDTSAWPIARTVVKDTLRGRVAFPDTLELPYGVHKIEWIADDDCGNRTVCQYDFEIKDCKIPGILCINGLSANIMQTGMVTIQLELFQPKVSDNCTPVNMLELGIRPDTPGLVFPKQQALTYTCQTLDTQRVQIWVRDRAGNTGFCRTYVLIQDPTGSCKPKPAQGETAEERNGTTHNALNTFVLYPIQPNPAKNGAVQIRFDLPEAGLAQISVFDLTGRLHYRSQASYAEGTQVQPIQLPAVNGLLLVQVKTAYGVAVEKVVNN
jgi:hypothetical protein